MSLLRSPSDLSPILLSRGLQALLLAECPSILQRRAAACLADLVARSGESHRPMIVAVVSALLEQSERSGSAVALAERLGCSLFDVLPPLWDACRAFSPPSSVPRTLQLVRTLCPALHPLLHNHFLSILPAVCVFLRNPDKPLRTAAVKCVGALARMAPALVIPQLTASLVEMTDVIGTPETISEIATLPEEALLPFAESLSALFRTPFAGPPVRNLTSCHALLSPRSHHSRPCTLPPRLR